MGAVLALLKGKKVYILGIISLIYAAASVFLGGVDYHTVLPIVQTALVGMGLRAGLVNTVAKFLEKP